MGIRLNAAHLVGKTIPLLGDLRGKKVLTLGVQDCHFSYDQALAFLLRHNIAHNPVPAGEVKLTTGFKWCPSSERHSYRNYIHQDTLFRLLGFDLNAVSAMDCSKYEGAQLAHDLNHPIDACFHSQFDVIFDSGTLEHIFSLKDALFNVVRLVKIEGLAIHFSPADFINHGFVNLNAELFADFYLSNGFEQVALKYIATPVHPELVDRHYLEFEPSEYLHSLGPYYATCVFSAFRKRREEAVLRVPQQGFYNSLLGRELYADEAEMKVSTDYKKRMLFRIKNWVDRFFLTCVVIRGYRIVLRGRRVNL